jgi:hypothetical protein
MQANVGGADRLVRIVVGVLLLAWFALGENDARWWGLLGLIPLVTGVVRWCPLYVPFGLKTCRTE